MKQLLTSFAVALIAISLVVVSKGAFHSHNTPPRTILHQLVGFPRTSSSSHPHGTHPYVNSSHGRGTMRPNHIIQIGRKNSRLYGWLQDALTALGLNPALEALKFQQQQQQQQLQTSSSSLSTRDKADSSLERKPKATYGTVIRTAAKAYDQQASVPSSPLYTTRKQSRANVVLLPGGVEGDYNHYRTTALKSTPDRAVSILTSDVIRMLREAGWTKVQEGDLGENIYVDGVDYTFFQVGKRYRFYQQSSQQQQQQEQKHDIVGKLKDEIEDGVIVEITERIEPCGNLCRLPYINDESLAPRERLEQCKKFLFWLDEKEGLRGWYGRVIGDGGIVHMGDQVSSVAVAAASS